MSEWCSAKSQIRRAGVVVFVPPLVVVLVVSAIVAMRRGILWVVACVLIVTWHRRIIHLLCAVVIIVVVVVLGIGARRRLLGVDRGGIEVVVEGDVRKCGLGKGFADKLAVLVLQMGIITASFLLGKLSSISETLFLATLDYRADSLVNLMAAVLLVIDESGELVSAISKVKLMLALRLPRMWNRRGM